MTDPSTVTHVQTYTARVSLPRELRIGDTVVGQREYAAVQIRSADGLVGKAYCLSRNAPVIEIIDRLISPHLIGAEVHDVPLTWDQLMRATAMIGRVGLVRRALGLVDIALWDIAAQRRDMPLWQVLGRTGDPRAAMLVAAYPTPDRTARSIVDEVLGHIDDGWALLKIARTPEIELVRNVVGTLSRELPPSVGLVVDASFGWRKSGDALSEIAAWDTPRLAWLEDPLLPEDLQGILRLRRESGLRLGVGDEVTDPALLTTLADLGAIDVARVDVVALGGITPTVAAIDELTERGMPISAHVYPEVTVHLGVGVETFARGAEGNPYDPAPTLVSGGPTFGGGRATPPPASGLGFALNEAAFERTPGR